MDKVRIGIVGCGGFARYRIGNTLKVKEAEIVALCDPSEDQIRQTKEKYPELADLPEFADHRRLLEDAKPDAVFMNTPHTLHAGQILDALGAGVHACTEKPMVTTVEDALRVIEARDKAGKVGMVSYQRHFQPEFRYIRERIRSGAAGAVQYISAVQCQGWLKGTKGTWRQTIALSGGGQLNDSGSHLVDILLWTTGLSPETVAALTENFGTEVDINSSLSVRFKGGALASVAVVGHAHNWNEDITIWCENESYFVRDNKLTIADAHGNRLKAESLAGGGTPDQNFVDAILGKTECESPFECGLEVIRLTQAAWESAAQGGKAVSVA